jgi:hypothetical protein
LPARRSPPSSARRSPGSWSAASPTARRTRSCGRCCRKRVHEAARGRAFAFYNAARNGAELFALLAGRVLVSTAGARVSLLLSGAVPLVIGVVAFLSVHGLRLPAPVKHAKVSPS